MQKTAQAWFTGGPTNNKSSTSLLADWNAYAAASSSEQKLHDSSSDPSSSLGFDLEAAVRTANDKATGTFNVVSTKGVKDLPGSFQNASGKSSFIYFGLLLGAAGMFFVFIAFTMFRSYQ